MGESVDGMLLLHYYPFLKWCCAQRFVVPAVALATALD